MPYFQIGGLLEPGLRNEFSQVYAPIYQGVRAQIGEVIWLEATSDKLEEIYGFMEAPLYMVRWPADSIIPSKAVESQRFAVINRDFGRRAVLPRNVEDDQTGTAVQFAHMLAQTAAILPEQIFYQYIQAGTDNDLLPNVPNSADGNALHISSTRYGSSSGNIVTQTSSWGTVQNVITDIFSTHRRFSEFQNTESQPFFDVSATKNMSVFYGTSVTQVAAEAEFQTRPHSVVSTTGAAITNPLQEAGFNIRWINSQRITNTRAYVFLRGLPESKRPIIRQVRKGYTEFPGNFVTSDFSRDTGQTYVQGDLREGWGSALAIATIRIS
jgi:hypothetical protein